MNLPPGSVFSFHKSGYALDFYAGYTIPDIPNLRLWKAAPHPADFYVYTDEEGQKDFKSKFGNQAGVMYVWPHRNPAKLSMEFLNPATRDSAITMRYFIHVNEITPPAQ